MVEEIKGKYPGVYYSIVPGPGGRGNEKKFYIKYRRGGRGSKEIHELLGSESQGWTEKRASDERLRRKASDAQSNAEKREALLEVEQSRKRLSAFNDIWEKYYEYGQAKCPDLSLRSDFNLYKRELKDILGGKSAESIQTRDIAALRKSAVKKRPFTANGQAHPWSCPPYSALGRQARALPNAGKPDFRYALCGQPENRNHDKRAACGISCCP